MLNTTFRNALVASGLLVGATLLITPAALAQESGGQVTGVVSDVSTLVFAPTTGTAITAGQAVAAYPIGSLTITNNNDAGWALQVKSAHGGELRYTVGLDTYAIAYTGLTVADIDGATITPVTFAAADTNVSLITAPYSSAVAAGITRTSTAAIAADQHVPAGTYSDTLTFTLTSN